MGQNRLADQSSPYLLQHKDNPVWWWSWSKEAFEFAAAQNKPVFLSSGYSTCYWCHVMERDSFEREDVAAVLNEHFVCIKLDREERPDIDQQYMDVLVGLSGHGGWPMSVFLTPDRKPFYAGTFFWRQPFIKLLEAIAGAWRERRQQLESSATEIVKVLEREQAVEEEGERSLAALHEELLQQLVANFDSQHGGFGSKPKFPSTPTLVWLCQCTARADLVVRTIEGMARGGIYDHCGGGFSRYSVDERWLIPHFEKMLYDNAQLVALYAGSFAHHNTQFAATVVRETIEFLEREMRCPKTGMYYSALDAGEVDHEGEYYVFTQTELELGLSNEQFAKAQNLFMITEDGNFEGNTNVLALRPETKLTERFKTETNPLRAQLRSLRAGRTPPHVDTKILVGHNGLLLWGMSKAQAYLGEYAQVTQQLATALLRLSEHKLTRCVGTAIPATLEDYAYLIAGLIEYGLVNQRVEYFDAARRLQNWQDELFWREGQYLFSCASDLLVDRAETSDGPTPSASAISLQNLTTLTAIFGESETMEKSPSLAKKLLSAASRAVGSHPSALLAIQMHEVGYELCIVAGASDVEFDSLKRAHTAGTARWSAVIKAELDLPATADKLLSADRKTVTLWRCRGTVCAAPVRGIENILREIAQ